MNPDALVEAFNAFVPIAEAAEAGGELPPDDEVLPALDALLDAVAAESPADQQIDIALATLQINENILRGVAGDDQAFEAFVTQEETLLVEKAGLTRRAARYLAGRLSRLRPDVRRFGRALKPVFARATDVEAIRRFARQHGHARGAVMRVVLVGGGSILIYVDAAHDPEPGSRDLSIALGTILVDRGFPELREWINSKKGPHDIHDIGPV
jgi:hypothetical protein